MIKFDVKTSEARTNVVDALYDQIVTFQLGDLKAATKSIEAVEIALAKKDNAQARKLLDEARALVAAMPVSEQQASSSEITGAFSGGKKKEKGARQAELEQQWAAFAKDHYAQAKTKADEALKLAK